jgi:hypothetical protein
MPIVVGGRGHRRELLSPGHSLPPPRSSGPASALLDAVTVGQEFIAVAADDREAILAVLDHATTDELVELRTSLFAELNWRRGLIGGAPSQPSPFANHG